MQIQELAARSGTTANAHESIKLPKILTSCLLAKTLKKHALLLVTRR